MFGSPGSATALIVEWFIKTTILLAPAFLAVAGSKRRTAAFRHFLLSFALIGLLLVPVLSLLPVGWRTPLLPVRQIEPLKIKQEASETGSVSSAVTVREPEAGAIPETADRVAVPIPPPPQSEAVAGPAQISEDPGFKKLASALSKMAGGIPEEQKALITDGAVLSVWLGGLALLLFRLALGLAGAARMTREGTGLAESDWRILLQRFLSVVRLRRTVLLKSHPEVPVPMTWGWRKPVILFPDGAGDWAETERSAALFHELCHIKRADYVFLILVRLSLSLFWWNPLCWVAYARIRREQEIACDELVLRAGIKPSTYAAGLLAFRRSAGLRWNASAALPGLFGRSSLQERLAAILKNKQIVKEVKMKVRISLAAAVILAVAFIGTARPAAGIETAAGASAAIVRDAPAQEVPTPVQEKEKEKAKVENKIVVDTAKKPVEVLVYRDGKVEKLLMDKPLTVTSGKEGQTIILGAHGGTFEVVEGKPGRLEIKEGQVLQLGEGETFTIDKDGGKIVITKKSVDKKGEGTEPVIVSGKAGAKIIVKTWEKGGAASAWKVVEPSEGNFAVAVEGKGGKATGWTVVKPKEGGLAYTVEGKDGRSLTWAPAEKLGGNLTFVSENNKEVLEQVRHLREQAAAIKAGKGDISELEKSLEKLEAELKEEKGFVGAWKAGTFAGVKPFKTEGGVYFVDRTGKGEAVAKAFGNMTWISDAKEGSIAIALVGKAGAEGKAAFDRAVGKLKSELPEGFSLEETKFNEESGAMTFRIQGPADRKIDADALNKIVEGLREEIKK